MGALTACTIYWEGQEVENRCETCERSAPHLSELLTDGYIDTFLI